MNVSLTAIALIWNAADQLAKLAAHGGASDSEEPGDDAAAQQADSLSAAHLEALLRQLFSALQVPPAEAPRLCLIWPKVCKVALWCAAEAVRCAPSRWPSAVTCCLAHAFESTWPGMARHTQLATACVTFSCAADHKP